MKRTLLVIVLTLVSISLFVGCGKDNKTPETTEQKEPAANIEMAEPVNDVPAAPQSSKSGISVQRDSEKNYVMKEAVEMLEKAKEADGTANEEQGQKTGLAAFDEDNLNKLLDDIVKETEE